MIRTKILLILAVFVSSSSVFADLTSPFPSTVAGVLIPNAHALNRKVFRGNEPLEHMEDLDKMGITDVLIFKNETAGEVRNEIRQLKGKTYQHVPLMWKDIKDFEGACEQSIEALNYILEVAESRHRKIFFHCTVGEDRTGMLAGLFRIAHDEWSVEQAFEDEMCAHGYEAANPEKPAFVVSAIREGLTPLYLAVADRIAVAAQKGEELTPALCKGLKINKRYNKRTFTCHR